MKRNPTFLRAAGSIAAAISLAAALLPAPVLAADDPTDPPRSEKFNQIRGETVPPASGAYEFGDQYVGTRITECPQAGMRVEPREIRRRQVDRVEQISDDGDDRRTNLEYSCFPQNETSVAINPRNRNNLLT